MSAIRRPSLDRMLARLDTGGLGRPQSPQSPQTPTSPGRIDTRGGYPSQRTPTSLGSSLTTRTAIRTIGSIAGRAAATAALKLLSAATKGPQMPQPTPWQPQNPNALAAPLSPPLAPANGMPMAMPTPQPYVPLRQESWPALPQRPAISPKPPGGQPRPPQMPRPNPYVRPAAQWPQPAPPGFPQPQGAAPGQNVDAYPIQFKPTQGEQKLFRKQQQQAISVPTLARHIGRLYKQLNLKVTPDTLPVFNNAHVLEKPVQLGSGAFNTVFSVKLKNPDGTAFDGVFKPLGSEERGWVAAATGIPKHDPQIAMRNIATVAYAKELRLDVVPSTRMAVIDTGRGVIDPDLGLIMEKARGKPAHETDASVLARGDVYAETTKLQLLDHLTGQGDRHANNYFINIENGRAKVMGIDNDQCFGKNLKDPAGIQQIKGSRLHYGFRGTALPPVVDTAMANSINSLTSDQIRAMLGNKLSEPEIEAAIARHEGVKAHIAKLQAQGRVIDPSQWNDPGFQGLMTAENSYIGRERARADKLAGRDNGRVGNHDF